MKVWVFQTGEPLHVDGESARPMRAMNLSNALLDAGHDVVLWSSDFYHQEKRHRFGENKVIQQSERLEIRLISSIGYSKNIGFGRLADHTQLAINLKRWLRNETEYPDVAFIGYPPIETAAVLSRWLNQKKIPSLLDIKDQWPSLFVEGFPGKIKILAKIAFYPYYYLARHTMKNVSGFSTMSQGFMDWACDFSGRDINNFDGVFPLTSPLAILTESDLAKANEWWSNIGISKDGKSKVCYVGSISPALDFSHIRIAAEISKKMNDGIQYIICGDGGANMEVKRMMSGLDNVYFPGWIDKLKTITLFDMCTAALAPYKNLPSFISSIPNKIFDYLSFGLPIISSLRGEVQCLLNEHQVGIIYGGTNNLSLHENILYLIENEAERKKMSERAKALYRDKYTYERVYGGLIKHLEMLSCKSG